MPEIIAGAFVFLRACLLEGDTFRPHPTMTLYLDLAHIDAVIVEPRKGARCARICSAAGNCLYVEVDPVALMQAVAQVKDQRGDR